MNTFRKATTAGAISIAGAGIAFGGIGLASADSSTGQDSTTQAISSVANASTPAPPMPAEGPGRGPGEGPGPGAPGGPNELAAGLSEALGLQESDVLAALEAVHEQIEPDAAAGGETRTPPTEAEQEARRTELASALAGELGVSEQRVTDALSSMATQHLAAARSVLTERLDTAVADGSLIQADKQSVLKAFDAGVVGGELHGPEGAGAPPQTPVAD